MSWDQRFLDPIVLPAGATLREAVAYLPQDLNALDAWASKQDDQPTRAEAVRRLVELGLKVKPPR